MQLKTLKEYGPYCIGWGLLIGGVAVYHDLFPLMLLTFVFTYFSLSAVQSLEQTMDYRKTAVCLLYAGLVALLVLSAVYLAPLVYHEARAALKGTPSGQAEIVTAVQGYMKAGVETIVGEKQANAWAEQGWYHAATEQGIELLRGYLPDMMKLAGTVVEQTVKSVLFFLLSLLFSFLIVIDYPNLQSSIRRILNESRLRHVNTDVVEQFGSFFAAIGQAFEAQAMISAVNALSTTVLVLFLGLPHIILITVMVFFLSFIPVFGIIIAALPIGWFALQTGGLLWCVIAVAGLFGIHTFEAYVLNPQIYGLHMELHPLIVLVVLLLGEHFFGIWGLLMAVPVTRYLYYDVLFERDVWE